MSVLPISLRNFMVFSYTLSVSLLPKQFVIPKTSTSLQPKRYKRVKPSSTSQPSIPIVLSQSNIIFFISSLQKYKITIFLTYKSCLITVLNVQPYKISIRKPCFILFIFCFKYQLSNFSSECGLP